MSEISRAKVYVILFLPFLLSMIISGLIIGYYMQLHRGEEVSPEEARILSMRILYTFSFYWSILQVAFGLYAIKLMGGWKKFREVYSVDDISRSPLRSIGLIIGLVVVVTAVIWLFQYISAILFYNSWEAYSSEWKTVVKEIPLYAKLYLVLVAPFTAGIFEEVLWRWFGIETLSRYHGIGKAVLIQAIAFGIWHGLSLHAIATFIIGLIYGLVYVKRRKLLVISISHILVDIIGFYSAFFLVTM